MSIDDKISHYENIMSRLMNDPYFSESKVDLDEVNFSGLGRYSLEVVEKARAYRDLQATIRSLQRIKRLRNHRRNLRLVLESEVFVTENFNEETKAPLTVVSDKTNKTLNVGQDTRLDLDDFFNRPVEIYAASLPLGTVPSPTEIKVWNLYTLEPSVRAKLRNYSYLRANLNIRVVISGTPFHMGRVMFSYQPHSNKNEALQAILTTLQRDAMTGYLSQSPYCLMMDVKSNEPAEMFAPFISQKVAFRLFNRQTTVISDVTPFADLENAGSLFLHIMNPIESVSATPSNAFVQIYAWLSDVELGVSTATQIQVQTESDEYEMGPVENISTKMAKISESLANVPLVGEYATPSKMLFNQVGNMASLLGFSKPAVMNDITFVKNRPFDAGAQCIGQDTAAKITVDPKQELTLAPDVVNRGDDELTIMNIASRESYINRFNWNSTDTELGNSLFKMCITPQLTTYNTAGTGFLYQPSSMAFAAQLFNYWRGDIKVKLQVVCSAYHKGKLLVYYEPNVSHESLIDPDIDLNKNFVAILDLAESDTLEFTINWAKEYPWARIAGPSGMENMHGSLFNPTGYEDWINGYIGIVPFTRLQSPDSGAVEVNVFVSCDNLRVNSFTGVHKPTTRIQQESESFVYDQDEKHTVVLNPTSATEDGITDYYFGEEPLSFRTLMKRYTTFHQGVLGAGLAGDRCVKLDFESVRPPVFQFSGSPAATSHSTLFSYLRYAFIGVRGGMRYRIFLENSKDYKRMERAIVTQVPTSGFITDSVTWTTASPFSAMRGSATIVPSTNGGFEFEMPYYSTNLFMISFAADGRGTLNPGEAATTWVQRWEALLPADRTDANTAVTVDAASGEDFAFFGYQGAPHYYV